MMGRPILTKDQLDAHRVTVGGVSDVIWNPLYDFQSYATAGQLQLTFFTLPQGQGTTSAPGASGAKTIADTNLTSAGQLTKGNEFYMTGQEIIFYPGATINEVGPGSAATTAGLFISDVWLVSKSGVLTLKVGSDRNYIQDGPIAMFPPVSRLAVAVAIGGDVTGAVTTTNTLTIAYAAMSGEPYSITPVYLESNQGFQETLTWPAVVAVSAAGRIGSRLRGYYVRQAQ